MFCLLALARSAKFEVELSVRYSSACPLSPESYLVVDNGQLLVKPSRRSSTFVRLHAGSHSISVSHPWCDFPQVNMQLRDDGSFRAEVNGSSITEYPIILRHHKMEEESPFSLMGLNPTLVKVLIGVVVVMRLFRWYMSKPENIEKIKKFQENMLAQQQELQRRQQEIQSKQQSR